MSSEVALANAPPVPRSAGRSALGPQDDDLQGFHLFTFNEVARTEAWREEWLARLTDDVPR